MDNKPIIAIATPHGNAGVGIIRISSSNLEDIIFNIFKKQLTPRYATLISIKDIDNQNIDEVIAIYFKSPNSYTGEDVLEIQAHGNTLLLDTIIQRCIEINKNLGLRIANPGEFTQRAFLNGKIDLIQAESVIDIINANSINAIKSANQSLQGKFSQEINNLLQQIIHIRILVESSIDFPEEELDYTHMENIEKQISNLIHQINIILEKAEQGYILNKGITIALVGEPNVGKSSLINSLAEKDIAIVTPIAGTTRDKISVDIKINGIVIKLIDTAGLRQTNDEIEEIGITRTWQAIEESNIILYLSSIDNQSEQSLELLNSIIQKYPDIPVIKVINKLDLCNNIDEIITNNSNNIYISAKNSYGIEYLKNKITQIVGYKNTSENIFLARKRHIIALQEAIETIYKAQSNFKYNNQFDIIAEDLRIAQSFINNITGEFSSDDLLGKIFSEFCIGK